MKIEDQVVSRGLAEKMKALGFDQNIKKGDCYYYEKRKGLWLVDSEARVESLGDKVVKAYSVAELGEMLPSKITRHKPNGEKYDSLITFWKLDYKYCGRIGEFDEYGLGFDADSEANVKAEMLIYLKENNLI